jgi:hypothetical protein
MKGFNTTLLVLGLVPAVGIGILAGCAEGTTEADPAESFLATTPLDAGTEDEGESVKLAPSNPSPSDDSDAGDDAGADSGKPDGDGGGAVACTAPSSCNGSTNLGSVRGDNGGDTKTAQGHTSQWFRVRVTEDDHGLQAAELRLTATLTSPPNANFDLYLYVAGNDSLACTTVSAQSTSSGTTDSAKVKFGESGILANGSDDDRTVTVEVRHVSGTCDPTNKWSLTVKGN